MELLFGILIAIAFISILELINIMSKSRDFSNSDLEDEFSSKIGNELNKSIKKNTSNMFMSSEEKKEYMESDKCKKIKKEVFERERKK